MRLVVAQYFTNRIATGYCYCCLPNDYRIVVCGGNNQRMDIPFRTKQTPIIVVRYIRISQSISIGIFPLVIGPIVASKIRTVYNIPSFDRRIQIILDLSTLLIGGYRLVVVPGRLEVVVGYERLGCPLEKQTSLLIIEEEIGGNVVEVRNRLVGQMKARILIWGKVFLSISLLHKTRSSWMKEDR